MYEYIFGLGAIIVLFLIIYIALTPCRNNIKFDEAIKTLYRQSARWAAASQQDEADLIKTLHANYAAGYLWAIKDIVGTDEFKRITGEDFLKLEKTIVKIQDNATKSLVKTCDKLKFTDDQVIIKAMYSG